MAGIGGAIAEGLESGFSMGLRADQAKLQRNQDQRAQDELNLRQVSQQRADRREGVKDNLDLLDRQNKLLAGQSQDIERRAAAAQAAGQPVDPADAAAYGGVQQQLAATRQKALDFFSRAQTGQLDPLQADPGDLYLHLTAATGMKPSQLQEMPQHIADVHAAMDTGNQGLLVQGVNGLMSPMLQRGVGTESPHGGTITRKEIIGLDPAVDNNHNPLPGKFMPRLRVYVRRDGGEHEQYYDAPMTVDGSGEPDAKVAVIDVAKAMNWMGNMGTLATALGNPQMQAKLAEGEKTAGPEADKYLQQLTNASRPAKTKGAAQDRMSAITQYAKDNKITDTEAATRLQQMGVLPAVNNLSQRLAAIDDLDIPEEQKEVMRRDVALGAGGKTTGLIPQKPGVAKGAAGTDAALSSKYGKDADYTKQVDYWADFKRNGGTLPARFSQTVGAAMAGDVLRKVAMSGSANEQLANEVEFGGAKAGARSVGTRAANFGLAKSEAYTMADLVTEASGKVSRTSFIPVNKAIIAFKENTGDVAVRQYGAAINSFIQAYARAVSPIGTPTVSDKDHARDMLSKADTHEAVVGIISQLKKEMEAAGAAPNVVRGEQRKAVLGLGGGGGGAPAAPAGVQTATNPKTGEKLMLQNGQWVPLR